MKKILVVFTGGTICTTIKNGEMNTDSDAIYALMNFYKKSDSYCKENVEFIKGEIFDTLSENMTVSKWNKLIDYIQETLKDQINIDGVIVAHGTDTLAYSTAMFSILLTGIKIPVIFVSSNNPIMIDNGEKNSSANGVENFIAAVECIYKGLSAGVYATYKNTEDNKMYLHKGEQLIQCTIYDDNFYSRDALCITDIENIEFSKAEKPENMSMPIVDMGEKRLKDCILKVNPYVGLNYNMYNLENVKAVLHSTYHSGTSCVERTENNNNYTENSILYFIDKCAKKNVPFYYSPSKTGEEQTVYASIPFIEKHIANSQKAHFYYGDTEELIYCKLLYAYSMGLSKNEINDLLNN